MIKKNPVKVDIVRGNMMFSFTVIEIRDPTSQEIEFEFHKRSMNLLELNDMAKHLKIPVYNAEKIVLEAAKNKHGGKLTNGIKKPPFKFNKYGKK